MGLWGWGGSVILVRHNFSFLPPAEHNFEHNTLFSRVTPESIILYFSSIVRQTLRRRLQLCLLSEQLRTSVAVTKLTSISWSLSILRGDYADILTRARFCLIATRLLFFILTPLAFSLVLFSKFKSACTTLYISTEGTGLLEME